MASCPVKPEEGFQRRFHERWGHLNDQHVRALAWLLDAPDLLAPGAPQWKGKIGSLEVDVISVRHWLGELDAHPEELHAYLNLNLVRRLGRYAERLMAFYFKHEGNLIEHGLQLRGKYQETIGEFDFLLKNGDEVLHVELATKFYLLGSRIPLCERSRAMDYFVGPNLADTLGLKVGKIIDKQLQLGRHPAASAQLLRPVGDSQVLIKGWLFYQDGELPDTEALGLAADHCRGFWCTVSSLAKRADQRYIILPRLSWLPPLKARPNYSLSGADLIEKLRAYFQDETMPVLIAQVVPDEGYALEVERGFIVPDDWQARAEESGAQSNSG